MLGNRKSQLLELEPNWDTIIMLAKHSHSVTSQMQRTLHQAMEWKNVFTPHPKSKPEYARDIERLVENSLRIEQQGRGGVASMLG